MQNTLNDPDSQGSLARLAERNEVKANQIPYVKTVLVVLSSRSMALDFESLRQKIRVAYPEAKVFFMNTAGVPAGEKGPSKIDLLIDFTGPGQRQGWFYSKKLRRMAKFAVGRNAGFFRKGSYDRIFDEKDDAQKVPTELLAREAFVQKQVLRLAGVPMAPFGDTPPDLGKSIALELPALKATGAARKV